MTLGEKLNELSFRELQKHKLLALTVPRCVKNVASAEGVSIPPNTPLHVGNSKGYVAKLESGNSHGSISFHIT
jgi:hypothetical protein